MARKKKSKTRPADRSIRAESAAAQAEPRIAPPDEISTESPESRSGEPPRRRDLAPLVVTAVLLALVLAGMALLPVAARAYLAIVPENYAEQATLAAKRGDTAAALDILLREWERQIYNFEAVYQAGEIAANEGTADDCRRALEALAASFDRYLAVKHRDVFSTGWNEARGLGLMGMCLGRIGRASEGALLASAAQDVDPIRSNLALREWAKSHGEALRAMQAAPPFPKSPDPDAIIESGGRLLWWADASDAAQRLESVSGSALNEGRIIGEGPSAELALYRWARLRIPMPSDVASLNSRTLLLRFEARATPAFAGWPVVIARTVNADGNLEAFIGAAGIRSNHPALVTLGPFDATKTAAIDIYYYNDQYDAETKQDRNLFLRWIGVSPAIAPQAAAD